MSVKNKNIEDFYPLSPMQQGILFHSIAAPESGVYFEQLSWTLEGNFNIAAFQQAWQQIVERHSILRTGFVWESLKEPVQVVHRQLTLPSVLLDLRHLSSVEQQQQLEAFLKSDRSVGFELTRPPLIRLTLHHLAKNYYHFTWSHHHLLIDGWSNATIFKEVFDCYKAFSKDQDVYLEPIRCYRDYIVWLQQQNLSQAEAFWRQLLKGFTTPTRLWVDKGFRQLLSSEDGNNQQEIKLSIEKTAALQFLGQQHQLTLNTLVQGAWALLLSRYSGEEDVVFGATTSGRPSTLAKAESMVGLFINTLPVRVKVSPKEFLLPWLKQIQTQQIETRQYEYSPLLKVQGWSEVPRSLPLFESIVVFENYPVDASLRKLDLNLEIKSFSAFERTNYPLTLSVNPGEELLLQITFDGNKRFDADIINWMLGHLKTLLEEMVANPQQHLSELKLLTEPERHQLLVEWNNTQVGYPQNQCIHQLFETQVERSPDAIAVVFEDQQLTYQELNQRANQVAYYLRALGVSPEVLVGICVERSLDMVIAILATLKAGGAYVPLDTSYPQERLALILEDAKPLVLLTQKQLVAQLPKHGAKVVCMDADWEINGFNCVHENPSSSVTAKNLAYVIYTSGSTGTPKGVLITHQALVNHSIAAAKVYELQPEDRILQFASISFDVAAEELFASWLSGSTVVIRPNRVLAFAHFLQFLKQEKLTVLNLPTAYWHEWVSDLAQTKASLPVTLRLVIVGTEQTLPEKLALWEKLVGDGQSHARGDLYEKLPSGHLRICWLNAYGPTEATIGVTIYEPASCQENQSVYSVPIGRPIANTQVYLLDKHLNPTPSGVPGELYIGGVGIARGYLNRPELTADKFIPNPFSEKSGTRLYKTGDLARYLSDGNIELLGRIDDQVKIRGFRIEPGEVESKLSQHAKIREALVVAREDEQSDKHLVAYVSAYPEQTLTATELRGFLQEKLPQYMVPSAFIVLPALPLLPNGKLDRRSLPAPETLRPELEVAYVMPQTEIEQAIATVWQISLNVEKIGIHDNFFELGGHSLLMVRVHTQLHEIFKTDLSLLDLFRYPTISSLAEFFNQAKNQTSSLNETLIQIEKISAGKSQQQKRLNKMKSMNNKGVKEE